MELSIWTLYKVSNTAYFPLSNYANPLVTSSTYILTVITHLMYKIKSTIVIAAEEEEYVTLYSTCDESRIFHVHVLQIAHPVMLQ